MSIEYIMSIDVLSDKIETFSGAICVLKKGGAFEYIKTLYNKKDFEEEVKRVAEYYCIDEKYIIKEEK